MSANNEIQVHYRTNKKTISFWCGGGSDIDFVPVDAALSEFLHDFSKGKKVFFHGYGLPEEELPNVVSTDRIQEKAEMLLAPYHIFLNLSDAKVNTAHFHCAHSISVFYFDEKVKWVDFLPISAVLSRKNIEKGKLLACFDSVDHGADFLFECSRDYEDNMLTLFRTLSDLGCTVKQVRRLPMD